MSIDLKPSIPKRRTFHSLHTKTSNAITHKPPISSFQFPSFSQGFHPFSSLSPSSPSSPSANSPDNLTFFALSSSTQDISKSDIDIILSSNKSKLKTITTRLSQKRREQYSSYLSSNTKHLKLLELNNIRSRMMTSLKSNVGEIFVKLMDEHKAEDYEYVLEGRKGWGNGTGMGWKPQSREGQTCVVYKDILYLIGGHNSNPLGDLCSYNFRDGNWSKVQGMNTERSYHTTSVYKDHYFIIFGGMSLYNTYYKSRDCLNSTLLFNPLDGGVKTIKIQNEHIVEPRRSHSACVIGKQLLVFGGINMFKSYLKDMIYLDFRELKWVELEYHIDTPELEEFLAQGIAKHAMIENFKSRQGHNKLSNRDYDPEEGVFVFGGANQTGIKSTLFQISFKRRSPRLHKLYPSGYVPSGVSPLVSRVNLNVIAVISGERTEREIKLYKIKQNEFVGVHFMNSIELGGIGSSVVKHNDQMHVLFGVGQKGYIGTVSSFKLDQKLKSQIEKQGKRQKRQSFIQKDFRILPTVTVIEAAE